MPNEALNRRFITFEGVDGCGKSTQLARTRLWLEGQGHDVVRAFEPGDTPLGAEIRRLLLAGDHLPVSETELLLFLADRAQHVQQVIRPALSRGAWVLCDRYSDSTLAYQLAARNLEGSGIREMLGFAECGLQPGSTLWFDVSLNEAMLRMEKRVAAGEKSTRLDDEAASFHQRVGEAFAEQFRLEPERIVRIDAGHSMDDVEGQVRVALAARYPELVQ